jgi:hypothetical protein
VRAERRWFRLHEKALRKMRLSRTAEARGSEMVGGEERLKVRKLAGCPRFPPSPPPACLEGRIRHTRLKARRSVPDAELPQVSP